MIWLNERCMKSAKCTVIVRILKYLSMELDIHNSDVGTIVVYELYSIYWGHWGIIIYILIIRYVCAVAIYQSHSRNFHLLPVLIDMWVWVRVFVLHKKANANWAELPLRANTIAKSHNLPRNLLVHLHQQNCGYFHAIRIIIYTINKHVFLFEHQPTRQLHSSMLMEDLCQLQT